MKRRASGRPKTARSESQPPDANRRGGGLFQCIPGSSEAYEASSDHRRQARWPLLSASCPSARRDFPLPLALDRTAPPLSGLGPVFFWGTDFFIPFLHRPGGLATYAAAFLAQLDYLAWLGGLVAVIETALLYLASRSLFFQINLTSSGLAAFAPICLWLILQNRYAFPVAEITVGLLLALWFSVLYSRFLSRPPVFRLPLFWLLVLVLFWGAGTTSALSVIGIGGFCELRCNRQLRSAIACWLAVLLVPLVCYLAEIGLLATLPSWGSGWPALAAILLYAFYPLAFAILMFGFPDRSRGDSSRPQSAYLPADQHQGKPTRRYTNIRLQWPRYALGLSFAALLYFSLDRQEQTSLRVSYFADEKQWDKVLANASPNALANPATRLYATLALFHTGRLASDLFSLRQTKADDLLPDTSRGLQVCPPLAETLLELGQINLAEHWASEVLELRGAHPPVLKTLAYINVLKNRPEAARIFFTRLEQIPFQRAWAARRLQALSVDARLSSDPELVPLWPRVVTTDNPDYQLATTSLLQQLLLSSPRNSMAFQYLMAHYLLTLQLDKLVGELWRLDQLACTDIPRHYEEAILLFLKSNPGKTVDLKGRRIRPATLRRFNALDVLMNQNQGRTAGLEPNLHRNFGDTLWFYFLFGQTHGDGIPQPSAVQSANP